MARGRTKQPVVLDREALIRELQNGLKQQAARPNLYAYHPHAKQQKFHKATAHSRLYIGGNRSGKTTGGVAEDLFWITGKHPYREIPAGPIRGRVVVVDFTQGLNAIILPEFKRWTPPSFLIDGSWDKSWDKNNRILTFANGSFIEFMSYEQDLEKFAGTSRHFVHYDEEPPKHIYNECQARLIDTGGSSWITMTPVEGMTWVYDDLYRPGTQGKDPDISVVEVDMLENPYINKDDAERYLKTLSKEERNAREHGTFVQLGGRVYKEFSRATHVVEPCVPSKEWEWYVSIDHGFNNPTAMLWHAVSPDNQVITFSEHYKSEMTIEEHAKEFHARNAMFGRVPDIVCGDPAMSQRSAITGTSIIEEYAKHGVYIATDGIPRAVDTGVVIINSYLKLDADNNCHWHITENCTNLIEEMLQLRWATWANKKAQFQNNKKEQIHKKDDHACDSARYFFTLLPDLTPVTPENVMEHMNTLMAEVVGAAVTAAPVTGSWDALLARRVKDENEGHSSRPQNWNIRESTALSALEYD